jgi:hypothetical protein
MTKLIRVSEPALLFGHSQATEDPRDGLTLFGPLDEGKPFGVRAGVIGTKAGIAYFKRWLRIIQGLILGKPARSRPFYPGFEVAFRIPWHGDPALEIEVPELEINQSVFLGDKYLRAFNTVSIYANRIIDTLNKEETSVDIWFVVVPDDIWRYCRPKSSVGPAERIVSGSSMSPSYAQSLEQNPSLFAEENQSSVPYYYEVNFHNQLKARLLEHRIATQVIRESTIAHREVKNKSGRPLRRLENLESQIAWGISTATFYKLSGRPWKLSDIRDGVCYIGLVFKQDQRHPDPRSACCAAQMFLDSGDGMVFKGDVGPWYNPEKGDFHLKDRAAKELIGIAIETYKQNNDGKTPKELFIHGRVRFNDEEWRGFQDAVNSTSTNLVGIRIRPDSDLKLYKKTDHPVLRGLAYIRDSRTSYLWTKGYTPRLQTYPGREVPNPLLIDLCRGDIDIEVVLRDIMALTKLNYNSCQFSDGVPVTLKFANAVGEILTAGPLGKVPPLPFRYYI